jgi:hypothetical protein
MVSITAFHSEYYETRDRSRTEKGILLQLHFSTYSSVSISTGILSLYVTEVTSVDGKLVNCKATLSSSNRSSQQTKTGHFKQWFDKSLARS